MLRYSLYSENNGSEAKERSPINIDFLDISLNKLNKHPAFEASYLKNLRGVSDMMADRARQIMDSLGVIDVKYQGNSVWIEQVEEDLATIRFLQSDRKLIVPVKLLAEV